MDVFPVASILFVNKQGWIILQKRDDKPGILNPGKITAWGGAVEGDETPLQAAVREIHEETNLKVNEQSFEFFGDYPRNQKIDGRKVVNHVFLLKNVDESTLEVYEGQGYERIDPAVPPTNPLYTNLTAELLRDYHARKQQ